MKILQYGVLGICVCTLLLSCNTKPVGSIERETLFTLDYGRFEDELDLFDVNQVYSLNTYIFMQNGIFFITDGKSKKIMQLTSYGDLLAVYYNEDTNPVPSFASDKVKTMPNLTTQQAIIYPFNKLGKITVDERKNIFIVDQIPVERQEKDKTNSLLLKDVVLHFANDGSYVDYIGQEGVGGTPFSFILGIYITNIGELMVVSQTTSGVTIHWFSPEGFLLYTVPIDIQNLPSPYTDKNTIHKSLENVICDFNERIAYLKIDYYIPEIDASTNVQAGISYRGTSVYPLNVETGTFLEGIDVSAFEETIQEGTVQETYAKPYDLLGITESGWFFFIVSDTSGYTIQLIHNTNHRIIKRHFDIRNTELIYNTFAVSKDGILSALLASEYNASVVWWRTDTLIGEVRR